MIQSSQNMTSQTKNPLYSSWNPGTLASQEASEERVDDLQALIDDKERVLTSKKGQLEECRQAEDLWKKTSDSEEKDLDKMIREDRILKKAEKALKFTAVPTPFIMGFGAVLQAPFVAAVGAVLLLGSIAVKLYAKKRLPQIDRQFGPLDNRHLASVNNYQAAKDNRVRTEGEVKILEKECTQLREKRDAAAAEVKRMAESLTWGDPSGTSEVLEDDDYVWIDSFKIRKHELEQD